MLVDTSGLFAVLSTADKHHKLVPQLLRAAPVRVVHSSVLTELVALADTRRENRTKTLNFIAEIITERHFKVIWLTESDHRESLALLKARPDKRYSLCDAASFIIMRRLNIREALTTDHHFEQEGFVRLLK